VKVMERIARREPQKNSSTFLKVLLFFCVRSGSPYFKLKIKN
jgi:hypothetical protein